MDNWLTLGLRQGKYKKSLEHVVYWKVRKCSVNKGMGMSRGPWKQFEEYLWVHTDIDNGVNKYMKVKGKSS